MICSFYSLLELCDGSGQFLSNLITSFPDLLSNGNEDVCTALGEAETAIDIDLQKTKIISIPV